MTRKIASPENPRRIFLQQVAGCCLALGTVAQAHAQTMVADTDAQATALSYKTDAGKVDKSKQPKYVLARLNSPPAPPPAETDLQLKEAPRADTARYDQLREIQQETEPNNAL